MDESEAENTASRIFGKVIGGAKQVVGVYKSARGGGEDEEEESSTSASSPTIRRKEEEDQPKTIKIFGKEIKQSTAILAGLGLAAAATITVIAVKKSRNKSRAAA